MRVLFVSSSSGSRGGGEYFLVYLAQALKTEGVEVGLWLSSDAQMDGIAELFGDTGPVFRQPYVNTFLRRSRSLSHLLPAGRGMEALVEQWKAFKPDILHLNKQCPESSRIPFKGPTCDAVAQPSHHRFQLCRRLGDVNGASLGNIQSSGCLKQVQAVFKALLVQVKDIRLEGLPLL
ncbi:MAG: hypothetical protein R6V45_06680, partial [Oceanipulchritudo sp.]